MKARLGQRTIRWMECRVGKLGNLATETVNRDPGNPSMANVAIPTSNSRI